MNKRPVISFNDFSFSYPEGDTVLHKIDLEIYEGERILILGPSGCGKSTLSLCLNGIIPHLIDGRISGSLKVSGMETSGTPVSVLSQKAGIVFQDPESQFCMLRVDDEIAFGPENLKKERSLIIKEIHDALSMVNMDSCEKMLLNHLSGGMKQRVALAALLAISQPVMIFDEPTSNLDPQGTYEVAELIRGLPSEKTLVIIEHKLDYFIDIFDRIAIMDSSGRIIAVDTPGEILTGREQVLKELGVWLPQIPKYMNKFIKSTKHITFDSHGQVPLNITEAKKAVSSSPFAGEIISFFSRMIEEEILAAPPAYNIESNRKPDPLITVKKLKFSYDGSGKMALKDISLTINEGDFIAIAGQNGSGKTTLAKILIGLLEPGPGSKISFRNPAAATGHSKLPAGSFRARTEDVLDFTGFVFQNPEHQFLEDTVYDEIIFGLKSVNKKRNILNDTLMERKAEDMLKLMGLEDFKERNPFSLSQGQKRRLSVASILVMDHQVLILDEPTFGQDYINTTGLMDILVEHHRNGKTIIIITHDMNLIFRYCNKVAVLKNGTLAYSGYTRELLYREDIIKECGLDVPPLLKLYRQVKNDAAL
ncbi:MAG: ABC transporter ATP-binding protein [Actinobacteria bacterium]|nr:ABC transporter ATP-binding protein [Actinomycetota bacterium]